MALAPPVYLGRVIRWHASICREPVSALPVSSTRGFRHPRARLACQFRHVAVVRHHLLQMAHARRRGRLDHGLTVEAVGPEAGVMRTVIAQLLQTLLGEATGEVERK